MFSKRAQNFSTEAIRDYCLFFKVIRGIEVFFSLFPVSLLVFQPFLLVELVQVVFKV